MAEKSKCSSTDPMKAQTQQLCRFFHFSGEMSDADRKVVSRTGHGHVVRREQGVARDYGGDDILVFAA